MPDSLVHAEWLDRLSKDEECAGLTPDKDHYLGVMVAMEADRLRHPFTVAAMKAPDFEELFRGSMRSRADPWMLEAIATDRQDKKPRAVSLHDAKYPLTGGARFRRENFLPA